MLAKGLELLCLQRAELADLPPPGPDKTFERLCLLGAVAKSDFLCFARSRPQFAAQFAPPLEARGIRRLKSVSQLIQLARPGGRAAARRSAAGPPARQGRGRTCVSFISRS